jgi:outer membrane lipoprotein-sorting protein
VLFLFALITVTGCRPKPLPSPLPTIEWVDEPTAIRALAERAKEIRTVQATCTLTLTRPDGQSVALDAILLSASPDRLRLQASKMSHKLFDLTLNPDGLFVQIDDPSRKDKLIPASISAARFAREWSMFNGGLFDATDLTTRDAGPRTLVVSRMLADGRRVTCEVDKPSLTARSYSLNDPAGGQRFSLTIPEYRLVAGVPYPQHMIAVSDQGTIDIEMRDVELNVELAEGAFVPPTRAQRQP